MRYFSIRPLWCADITTSAACTSSACDSSQHNSRHLRAVLDRISNLKAAGGILFLGVGMVAVLSGHENPAEQHCMQHLDADLLASTVAVAHVCLNNGQLSLRLRYVDRLSGACC